MTIDAVKLADYVKQPFKPCLKDPKYKGPHGLDDSFFRDTVSNAMRWRSKNGANFKGK